MNILVTGGAGFIASHIVDAYIALGHRVVVIDNLSSGKKEQVHPKATFYKADILDKTILDILKSESVDVVNHQAAQIDVRKSVVDPVFDARVNIEGSLNLFEACRKTSVKKIIFASSGGAIYGDTTVLPTPENCYPYTPTSPYGIAKLTVEHYLYFYHHLYGIDYVALRYANVYGPRQDPFGEAGVVAIFIKKMLNGEESVINGDGEQVRDFVFVKDVASANVAALEQSFVGAANIGTSVETSVNRLFQSLVELIKREIPQKHGPAKQGEQKKSCLSYGLAKKELGWEPKYSLHEGLLHTISYFRGQR